MKAAGIRFATLGAALVLVGGAALFSSSDGAPQSDAVGVVLQAERSARLRWHAAERMHGTESPEAGAELGRLVQV